MAVQDSPVCKYYQTGFCKYRSYCKNRHIKDECEQSDCDDKTCPRRNILIKEKRLEYWRVLEIVKENVIYSTVELRWYYSRVVQ